ncbi:PAS domain-containing protein [Spongiimicrobium salis]|uniref:PAS domain-containing protein n=1 Tax=Spongiimicrobium salis TaxID=1667022 RepID=UPI00374D65F5
MVRINSILNNNYLIKQLPQATVFINHKREIVHASDKWVTDFNLADRDIVGKNIVLLLQDIGDNITQTMEECLQDMQAKKFTLPYESATETRWLEWTTIPWHDEKENIIGIIVQTEDITQTVLNETKLEKSEIFLNEISEISKIGNWHYDFINKKFSCSDMVRIIHEVPSDYEFNPKNAINFYKKGYDRNTISMAVFKATENGIPWSEKLQIITQKGNEKWVISSGKPTFKDGKLVGIVGTFQDVTDYVISEMKTRENEQLLRTLINNLPLNVFIKDLESRKVLVNKAEMEFHHLSEAEILGKNDFHFYDEETARTCREEDVSVFNNKTSILGKENIAVKKNGEMIHLLTYKIPLKNEEGKITGLVGFNLDISDLKQKESALRDLVNVTSIQNKKLIDFAHIVSHNLRSHTANFAMLLDFLVQEQDEDEKKRILGMLTSTSDNLLETLDNLNEAIVITTNTQIKKEPVLLCKALKNIVQTLTPLLEESNTKISCNVPEGTIINVIPEYLDNILANFISNAVKYRSAKRAPKIVCSTEKQGKYTILSISDNGIGIDMEKYGDKLFGMYKTFHNNDNSKGIGLYVTKNQIEAMKGKIMTFSKVGKGTTFKIYFNEED